MKPLNFLRNHVHLLGLIGIYLIVSYNYMITISPFEGPDELEHFAYISKLRQEKQLPDAESDFDTPIAQEVSQPPFYYVTIALVTSINSSNNWETEILPRNQWFGGAIHSVKDNHNTFLMDPDINILTDNHHKMVKALNQMRFVTLFLGVLTIIGVYMAGLALWPGEKQWALLAAMGTIFTPTVLQTFVLVGNDASAIALASWIIAISLYIYRDWKNPRLHILAGIILGIGALSKASLLALVSLPISSIFLAWWTESDKKVYSLSMITGIFRISAITVLIGGWWYFRGWILYGDPLGIEPHQKMPWAFENPQPVLDVLERLNVIRLTLWANFGVGEIRPGLWAYSVPILAISLSIIGWFRTRYHYSMILLLLTASLGLLALIRWMQLFSLITGRLYLPYYTALVLLIVWGLRQFPPIRYWFAAGLGATIVLLIPFTLQPAFGPPVLYENTPDNLQGPVINFNGPQFEGYKVDQTEIEKGNIITFTLCWTAPESNNPVPVPFPFALHILGPESEIVARQESYPGLGNYTLWEPGKSFCDEVEVYIGTRLNQGQIYPIWLTLFDVETQQPLPAISPDGQTINNYTIGYLTSPARTIDNSLLEATKFRFEQIGLVEYQSEITGNQLILDLHWGTFNTPEKQLNLFVHIIDSAGDIATQVDVVPGGTKYPIQFWDDREYIIDTVIVPLENLPAGTYEVYIGLYSPETFARVPVFNTMGQPQTNDATLLETIQIE